MIDVDQGVKAGVLLGAVAVIAALVWLIWRAARGTRAGRAIVTAAAVGAGVLLVLLLPLIWLRASFHEGPVPHARPLQPDFQEPAGRASAWTAEGGKGGVPQWVAEPALSTPEVATLGAGTEEFSYFKPDGRGRLAGFSGFASSEEEARRQAWGSAERQLFSLVEANCAVTKRRFADPLQRARLQPFIESEIETRRPDLELDAFSEAVELEYGTVYRAAVLLDARPALVEAVAAAASGAFEEDSRLREEQRRRRLTTWAYSAGGGLFLLLVVLAVYIFLNAHTKGYYAWPLRLLALLLYLTSMGGFLVLLRRFSSGP